MPLRWSPPVELSRSEEMVIKRCSKRKLFIFLRRHRHEIFDDEMQTALASAYDERRRGEEPVPPAQLAMAALLQAAFNVPDADVPELVVMERRWQMVLDCAGVDEPPFTQATVFRFRRRMIEHGLDKVLFDKTVALAKKTGAFGTAKLRAAFDSCSLYGAGRVKDTFNLIGHAAFHVVRTAAERLGTSVEHVAAAAGIPVVVASSIKAGLDIDWDDPEARQEGLGALLAQVEALLSWLLHESRIELETPPLAEQVTTLMTLIEQDTEPDPEGGGRKISDGVAKDRIISLGDRQMRHGRKSKRQRIDGYKRHIAVDVDSPQFIIAVAVTPANRPEREAAKDLLEEIEARGRPLDELQIDRGYLGDDEIEARRLAGMTVVSKPFPLHNRGMFTKNDFAIDLAGGTVTCPNDVVAPLTLGLVLPLPRCRVQGLPEANRLHARQAGRAQPRDPRQRALSAAATSGTKDQGRALACARSEPRRTRSCTPRITQRSARPLPRALKEPLRPAAPRRARELARTRDHRGLKTPPREPGITCDGG